MSEYISKDTVLDILASFYGSATPKEENTIMKVWHAVKETPAAPVVEVRPLRYDPHMEQLLKEAGWE